MKYSFKRSPNGNYYVFDDDLINPFDGPMTLEEAEILTANFNETPEPNETDENPTIRAISLMIQELKQYIDMPSQLIELKYSTFSAYNPEFHPLESPWNGEKNEAQNLH
jgi:hypothetical protein